MKLFQLEGLKWPSFVDVTLAFLISVCLWAVTVFAGVYGDSIKSSGGVLLAMLCGSISSACGIKLTKGPAYLFWNVVISALVGVIYLFAISLF
jgi:hypothetical protein